MYDLMLYGVTCEVHDSVQESDKFNVLCRCAKFVVLCRSLLKLCAGVCTG